MFHGALASAGATFVGHLPWFATFNTLQEMVPRREDTVGKLARNAAIGFVSSGACMQRAARWRCSCDCTASLQSRGSRTRPAYVQPRASVAASRSHQRHHQQLHPRHQDVPPDDGARGGAVQRGREAVRHLVELQAQFAERAVSLHTLLMPPPTPITPSTARSAASSRRTASPACCSAASARASSRTACRASCSRCCGGRLTTRGPRATSSAGRRRRAGCGVRAGSNGCRG